MSNICAFFFRSDKGIDKKWKVLAEPEVNRPNPTLYAKSMTTKGSSERVVKIWEQMTLSVYYRKVYPLSFIESIREEKKKAVQTQMPSIQEEHQGSTE